MWTPGRWRVRIGGLLAAALGCVCSPPAGKSAPSSALVSSADQAWAQVPALLQRIIPPTFSTREFSITNSGAIGDGQADCTKAFRDAIAACHQSGGGKVIVPAGNFFTGPIHLKSNIELRLAKGAEVIFSDRFADYLPPVLVRVG